MESGSLIGCFLIEKVLRPYQDGNALLEVRYEGSYIRGILCVADLSLYGEYAKPDLTVQMIKHNCASFKCAINVRSLPAVEVLLPTHVSSVEFDGKPKILGFFPFSTADAYLSGTREFMPLAAFEAAGHILNQVHKKGVGHGLLHPMTVKRILSKKWMLPCPVFPVGPFASENMIGDAIAHDRKVFALMFADALSGNADSGKFNKRFESVDTYIAAYPQIKRFLEDKEAPFASLFEDPVEIEPVIVVKGKLGKIAIAVFIVVLLFVLLYVFSDKRILDLLNHE